MTSRPAAISQAVGVVASSALMTVLAKLVLRDVPALSYVALQILFGGIFMTWWTFGWRRARVPAGLGRAVWLRIIWIGVANFAIVRVFFILSIDRLPATTHAFLVNLVGVATMVLSVIMLGERPSIVQIAGALLALAGVGVFFRDIPAPTQLTGACFTLGGVVALATTNNVARGLSFMTDGRLTTEVLSTVALWIGGIPVVVAGLSLHWPPPVSEPWHWAVIVASGAVIIAFGMTVWNHVLRTLRSYEASVLAACAVIFAAIFAMPILGETLGVREGAGIVLMVAGVSLTQVRRRD